MNTFLTSCLFVLFVLFVDVYSSSVVKNRYFSCNPVEPEYVKIFGIEFTCSDDKICNLFDISFGDRSPPCIDRADMCEDRFECRVDGKVQFKNVAFAFECGTNQVCNKDYKLPCNECICEGFKCTNNTGVVLIEGFGEYACPAGKVCNVYNIAPCDVCVNK